MPTRIILYTRPDCHLCEEAKDLLQSLQGEYNFQIHEVDISGNADLEAKFGDIIPVLDFQGGRSLFGAVDETQMRRALEQNLCG